MRIIHCKKNKFLSYEALFRFMIRNNHKWVKIKIEDKGVKSREQTLTYNEVRSILLEEKYNVDEIVKNELEKYGTI